MHHFPMEEQLFKNCCKLVDGEGLKSLFLQMYTFIHYALLQAEDDLNILISIVSTLGIIFSQL